MNYHMSDNCCLAHIHGSAYKEFYSMILKYVTCLKMSIFTFLMKSWFVEVPLKF